MQPFSKDEQAFLLLLARQALTAAVAGERFDFSSTAARLPSERLRQAGACFVTLYRRGQLRGCVGSVSAARPLVEAVAESAVAAALRDTRFSPVELEELPDLEIEISVLSPFAPVRPEEVQPGEHGLMVTQGFCRGLLLPQVAREYGWTWEQFLEATCRKAGLPGEAWKQGATLEAFTALVFSEASVAAESPRPA